MGVLKPRLEDSNSIRLSRDPTVTDDSSKGYKKGNVWINNSTNAVFIMADVTVGAAVWTQVSGGGSSFSIGYKNRLTLLVDSTSAATVTAEDIVLRGFDRGAGGDPVEYNDESIDLNAVSLNISTGTVGPNGFTSAPGAGTMWRVFIISDGQGDDALLASPFTPASSVEDDLPDSNDIPSQYEYIREVGELYVDGSTNLLTGLYRTDDEVSFPSPETVFTNASVSTPDTVSFPDSIPSGCQEIKFYAHTVATTASDVAIAIQPLNNGPYEQYQYQNIGFEAYVESPTGVQGGQPNWQQWDGSVGCRRKSMKSGNAATGSQSLFITSYRRKV